MAALAIPLVAGLAASAALPAGFTALGMSAFGWGWAIGSMAASYLLAPDSEGPRLNDLGAGGSSYGVPIPLCYGTTKVSGNVIWATDLIETKHTESAKGGPEYTSYTYSQHLAVMVCAGPVTGIRRIWANGKLILDASDTNTGATGQTGNVRIYTGTESQVADSLLESRLGVGNVPAHRGYCYVVFDNLQLADYGNRTPSFEFEVVGDGALVRPAAELVTSTAVHNGLIDPATWRLIWVEQNRTYIRFYDLATEAVIMTITIGTADAEWIELGDPSTRTLWVKRWNDFDIYSIDTGERIATMTHPGASVSTKTMRWYAFDQSFLAIQGGNILRFVEDELGAWSYTSLYTIAGLGTSWQSMEVTPYGSVVLFSDYDSKLVVLDPFYRVVLDYDVVAGGGSLTWIHTSTYDRSRNQVYICASSGEDMLVVDLNGIVPTVTEVALDSTGNVWPLYHAQSDSIIVASTGTAPTVSVRDPDAPATAVDTFYGDPGDWPASFFNGWPIEVPGLDDMVYHVGQNPGIDRFQFGKRITANQVPLSAIVGDLCERAGLDPADYDVSELTEMVDGYKTT